MGAIAIRNEVARVRQRFERMGVKSTLVIVMTKTARQFGLGLFSDHHNNGVHGHSLF
jgi:hypothetical protein